MNKLDELTHIHDEIDQYHRHNDHMITQHFNQEQTSRMPYFKFGLAFLSIVLVVFMSSQLLLRDNQRMADQVDAKKPMSEAVKASDERSLIFLVKSQKKIKDTYEVVLESFDQAELIIKSDHEVVIGEYVVIIKNQLYRAKLIDGQWYYQENEQLKKVVGHDE